MKKLILIASFILGLGYMANAQLIQKSPEKRASHQTKALTKALNLSQMQATQVNNLLLAQNNRIDSLNSNPGQDIKANKLAAKGIKIDTKKQIFALLDDTQKQKLADWEKLKKEKHKAKKGQPAMNSDTDQG